MGYVPSPPPPYQYPKKGEKKIAPPAPPVIISAKKYNEPGEDLEARYFRLTGKKLFE